MKFALKKKKIYFLMFFICILLMFYNVVAETGAINTFIEYLMYPEGIPEFMQRSDLGRFLNADANAFDIFLVVIKHSSRTFDYDIVWSTRIFQIIIPLFSIICGIDFYKKYHTIYKFSSHKNKSYPKLLVKKIMGNACLLSACLYTAYFVFLIAMFIVSNGHVSGQLVRELFLDWFGEKFYLGNEVIYFLVEGFLRFFIIPFVYSCFAQSCVLVFKHLKHVIAVPLLYYYGLTAVGFALLNYYPNFALYINPVIIMASGDHTGINTCFIILSNLMPLYISLGLIGWRCFYVEI